MQAAGETDGGAMHMDVVFMQPAGGKVAPLLDEVFGSFMETNMFQGQHYALSMLLQVTEKLHFRFMHGGIAYLATEIYWNKRSGWASLPGSMAMFPTLQRFVSDRYSKAAVFYHSGAERIDMEFEPKVATDPVFMVTFEPGTPYVDTKAMRRPF
ncbi:hypothetical protein GPECTOR_39g377 [Gonium pectorale]|uniref:Uncharacterized protein n=1 Tax=Gonium pectorale TaxID=33097 RepID=A0A150GAU0_GONPE|nr:hypothetical protein GPECTOR_39g377 [Gonium pectorale]|eukprot:KXZ46883.1 hypothetical protein GPECTOR_39g377 [Gonium pectorale]